VRFFLFVLLKKLKSLSYNEIKIKKKNFL